MLYRLFFILIFFAIIACTGEKTDQTLLENDKIKLIENLDSHKVLVYKFAKISLRSIVADPNTIPSDYQIFNDRMRSVSTKIMKYNTGESLSVLDYIAIYKDYNAMHSFLAAADEDIFPTTIEALNYFLEDSLTPKKPLLKGNAKRIAQNKEHAALSAIVLLSKDLGKEISLYECAKTNPKTLADGELKALLQYIRGFIFFEKGLYYLSEDEISHNIKWLDANPDVALPAMRSFFSWQSLNDQQTHTAFHGLQYLFRGFDRIMMKRDIDQERALNDFQVFLDDSKKLGLENEIIWAIETFLYIKNEDTNKAINSLQKLKTSNLLSSSEKKSIEQSIEYLQNRDSEALLNDAYDKYFLSKITAKYMYRLFSKIDWKQIMQEQEIPHADEILLMLNKFQSFMIEMEKYNSSESIEEISNSLKEESGKLWEKGKKLWEN